MSLDSKSDQVKGKIKEGTGKVTGNEELELKGKLQNAAGKAKDKLEDAKEKASKKANDVMDDNDDK
ncbi:CsbD family protein [Lentilactobacillus sp. SPB1-3]|uniref:CsbD family protein n=1 Tax=Lentilactobacillus terminaliae TaxID=3003483 RepID=A0ACD5DEZ0_9LACO|nr:CsbD family protein [Lentilactobacillus sp. SPB1-3]MCZ0976238.1 CsbD family protein [Lentilactobacillus sp. SPB1-3]